MIFLNEKGTCLDVLYPGSSEEWQELSAFIDKIFASRWISEKSRITLREGRYILNGQKFHFSEKERKYLSIVVFNLIVKGKIVLPRSPNFYSGESLLGNPYRMELFGKDKISSQVSLKIGKVLLLLADCQKGGIRNGHRTFTSYNLRPPEHWRIDDGQELAASMILH